MSAHDIVRDTVTGDPRLKLLTAVAAIGAVISIVLGFTGEDRALAIIGGVFVVAFMILLAIFISITNGEQKRPFLAAFLIWSVAIGFVSAVYLVMSSYFGCWPRVLGRGCVERGYVRGEISDLPRRAKKEIGVAFDHYAMGAFHKDFKAFRFVVFDHQETDRETLTITVRPVDAADDSDEDIKVHLSCIAPFQQSRRMIRWRYVEEDQTLPSGTPVKTPTLYSGKRKIGEFGIKDDIRCDEQRGSAQALAPGRGTLWSRLLPSMAAQAQTGDAAPAAPTPQLKAAIDNLKADDAATRRAARSILAEGSLLAIPAILQAMRENADNYRVLLGVSVALTEMLRQNKAEAPRIADIITAPGDRDLLLNAAGHPDRTLRIYASEFLYDLGDPDISRKALAKAAQTTDENARYQWLLVAQGGWGKLKPEQKAAASADLVAASAASGPVTRRLLDKLN